MFGREMRLALLSRISAGQDKELKLHVIKRMALNSHQLPHYQSKKGNFDSFIIFTVSQCVRTLNCFYKSSVCICRIVKS